MNIAKKTYCRVFQIGLRVALPVLPYRNPEVLKRTAEILNALEREGLKCPLVVTDVNLKELEIFKALVATLENSGVKFKIYDKVAPNPTARMVGAALKMYQENGCDCLIAFGGGSPIDCAKAVAARVARPKKSLAKMAGIFNSGDFRVGWKKSVYRR